TRVRAFGTAFILALGTLAGAFVPTLSGWVLEVYGVGGMFTLMAGMYVTFAAVLQLAPETFGRPLDTCFQSDRPGPPRPLRLPFCLIPYCSSPPTPPARPRP